MPVLEIFQPSAVLHPGEAGPVDFTPFAWRFLAQGDSWFSFGSLLPWATSNLLNPLDLKASACAVNCAMPGKELVHMVDARRDPAFLNLLLGMFEMPWTALLLSGGGNDLIDAIRTPSLDAHGHPVDRALRLLLTPEERGDVASVAGYISEAGWATFEAHIVAQFHEFVAARDDARSRSRGVPIFCHTYDIVTPRNAGAGLNHGPWLWPALNAYAVPEADRIALARAFLERLEVLLLTLDLPNVHVVPTQGILEPADAVSGPSHDWENEIHPNPGGYAKLAQRYGAAIDAVLG
jgi:hypothetical protein